MCDCINLVNATMRDLKLNTQVCYTIPLKNGVVRKIMLMSEKADPKNRKKPISMVAAFCPVCGEEYKDEPAN